MSVVTILSQMATDIPTLLGSSWSELSYTYEVEKNTFRTGSQGYGIGVGEGITTEGVVKSVTHDQEFFIVLTKTFANKSDDTNQRNALNTLYTAKELLDKNIFQKKLNLANIVLVVSEIGTDAPEVIDKTLILTSRYNVRYRLSTT